ncbi:MAG: capsular biosynthesis protein [Alteromonadaceae bacterium]|nr:capsular biosynthesis protein [Alteromonadaceae bacterium]
MYLFITRKSSHYRYYQKLLTYFASDAQLLTIKGLVLPRFEYWPDLQKLDVNDLVDVHIQRKQARHPLLQKFAWIRSLATSYYRYREQVRATYYFAYFTKHQPQKIVLWNGMKQPNKTPVEVARALNIPVFLFENGLLPNTTVLDPKGVNALNSLPRERTFYEKLPTPDVMFKPRLQQREFHKFKKLSKQSSVLPKHFIFVPFQVANDTQVICHSPFIHSMEHLYEVLTDALRQLHQSGYSDIHLVMKEHPSWPKSYKALYDAHPNIIFANNETSQSLIEQSLGVITINSTVGIEAIMLGKPVITLGDACYNIDGIVHHCPNQESLNHAIVEFWQENPNQPLRDKFLYYLAKHYLLPGKWSDVDDTSIEHFEAVQRRLLSSPDISL